MPLDNPSVKSAFAELQRRGVAVPAVAQPTVAASANIPMAQPAAAPVAAEIPQAASNLPPHLGGGQFPSQVALERNLQVKKVQGELAIQDAVNELKRRGVNLQLRTQPATETIVETQAREAVENVQKQGDPEAFKSAWRALFPGKPLPRTPEGQIDYNGGQDDIDVEMDRRKKIESAKAGVHNVSEHKVTRTDPATGKDREYLVRTDKTTGQVLGETLISESAKAMTEVQSNAKMFSSRLASNNQTLLNIESKGFDPTAIGTTVQSFLPNRFRSEDFQAYNAAKQNWIAAVLRKESGAAISSKEYSDANKQYFPQDGDSKSVVQQKQQLRQQVEQQMRSAAGPHAPVEGAPAPAAPGAAAPAAPAAPEAPVQVNSPAEAPPTAKFIRSPSGRVYRNPKYTGQ